VAEVHERALTVGGLRTRLFEAGPSDGDAVAFVHGNPGSARDWRALIADTGELRRALALDMPGFGQASKPKDFEYDMRGYSRFLGEALEQLGVERTLLVLHDSGGMFGLAWAIDNPDAFRGVVLMDTGALIDFRWHVLARIWRTPVLGELFQATATRAAFRLLIKRGNPRSLPRDFVDEMYDHYDRGTRRAVLRLYRATDESDIAALAPKLRPLDRPALVIWGAHDPYVPAEQAERQREAFPSARLLVLPESGHWPFVDDPETVSRALLPFVEETLASVERPTEHR
jgi:pimeloyl-ACP methyl ester carboxylesterase